MNETPSRYGRLLIPLLLVLANLPFLFETIEWWIHNAFSMVSFSILMPVVAAAACLIRRRKGSHNRPRAQEGPQDEGKKTAVPADTGVFWFSLGAIGLCLAGMLVAQPILQSAGLWIAVASLVGWYGGRERAKELVLPLFPLLLAAPLTWGWPARVEALFQQSSAWFGELWLSAGGVEVVRQGLVLQTPAFRNLVDDTCSGVSTVSALLIFTMVLGVIYEVQDRRVVLVMCLAIPLGLLANGGRIAWISMLGEREGSRLVEGIWHHLTGLTVFGVAYAVLLLALWLARKRRKGEAIAHTREPPRDSGPMR
ncbi:MAG: exosortase/archaeosortase family protein [Bradymonadales bacterium]|nr:exosortase/archaeosortase family protein [Bradymonadales bacterium]